MLRAAALVASAAMVAISVQSGSANASTEREVGATALVLTADARLQAITAAQNTAADTARAIGLADDERLVARDVIKDADGMVHTRYERTYAGLPVLGGDLVVHQKKDGRRKTTKGIEARIAPAAARSSLKAAPAGARQVVWAASGNPVFAYEAVVTSTQHDGTPSERHVITDAATGAELYSYEAIDTGTGASQYSGSVTLDTTQSGASYSLTDGIRGGHKTYDLNGGTTGTGSLFTDADDKWGDGLPSNRQTAAADAHYGAAVTWDFYKSEFGRNGIAGDGKAAYSRVHYGNAYVNAFWSDGCFCMTYGDGAANQKPLTSLDVMRPRDEPRPDRRHGQAELQPRVGRPQRGHQRHLRHLGGVLRQQLGRRRRLPHRREDRHPRRRHAAALHGQAQQGRRLGRLLVQDRRPASTCTTPRAWPTTSSTCSPRAAARRRSTGSRTTRPPTTVRR